MYVSLQERLLQESLLSKSRVVSSGNPDDIRSVVAGAIDKLIIPETLKEYSSYIGHLSAKLEGDKVRIFEGSENNNYNIPEIIINFDKWEKLKLPKHIVFDLDMGSFSIDNNNKGKIDGYTFEVMDSGVFAIIIKDTTLNITNTTYITHCLQLSPKYPYGEIPYYLIKSDGKKINTIQHKDIFEKLTSTVFNSTNKVILKDSPIQNGYIWFVNFNVTISRTDQLDNKVPYPYLKTDYVPGTPKNKIKQERYKNSKGYGALYGEKFPFNKKFENFIEKTLYNDLILKLNSGSKISSIKFKEKEGVLMNHNSGWDI